MFNGIFILLYNGICGVFIAFQDHSNCLYPCQDLGRIIYFFSHFVAVHSSSNHSSVSPSSAHVSVTKRFSLAYAAVAYLPTPRPNHPQGPPLPARQGDALSEVYVAGMGCAMIFALWATFAAFFNFLGLTFGESTK